MSTLRVVLVDDQPLIVDAFSTILNATADIDVVGVAGDGQQALEVVAATAPDVVCMDIEMPVMDGITATAQILQRHNLDVVILTTFAREDYLIRALEAGASGFLLKTASAEQLAEALRSVASGDALLAPEVTRAVITAAVRSSANSAAGSSSTSDLNSTPGPNSHTQAGPPTQPLENPLTVRETDVLIQAASGASNTEIAQTLFLSAETVKSHVSAILLKLGLRNRVQMVAYAYQQGLIPL